MIRARLTLFALALVAFAHAAHAQPSPLGSFTLMGGWYVHPFTGSIGTSIDNGLVTVDTDGNGLMNPPADHAHDIPTVHETGTWNWRLTPSRQVLYVFGVPSPVSGCSGGTWVYFYRIPAADGAPLELLTSRCIARGIAMDRFFEDPGTWSQRVACIVEHSDPIGSGPQRVHWVDLATGAFATSFPALNRVVSEVDISPAGEAAWIQSDASDGDNASDYSIVCLGSAHFGEILNVGGGVLSQVGAPYASAEMIEVSGDRYVRVHWPNGSAVLADLPVSTCISSPPPPPPGGACCLPTGGCLNGVTAGDCAAAGGTYRGNGTACATVDCPPPPAPNLSVTLSGPATVQRPQNLTWTIAWSNTGNLAAGGVTVVDSLPVNVTFVSASGGGTYDSFSRRITWAVGTLAAGASGSATITVTTLCNGAASVANSVYRIAASPGGTVAGSPAVTTTLTSPPTNPVAVSITATPQSTPPLGDGGEIEYAITLVEGAALARDVVKFSFNPGPPATLGAVLDSAGGSIRPQAFSSSYDWTGPLPANATRTIRFRAVVSPCRTEADTTTRLNNGGLLIAANACGGLLGFATPPAAIRVVPPAVQLELVPLAGNPPAGPMRVRITPARPGVDFDVELRVRNASASPKTLEAVSVPLPFTVTSADPPFVGSPPAGVTWDANLRTIGWSGVLAAGASLAVPFRIALDPAAGGGRLDASARLAGCATGPSAILWMMDVQPPPLAPHLLQLDTRGRIVATVMHGGVGATVPVLTSPQGMVSSFGGFGRLPNGDLYIAGQPSMRINLATMAFEDLGDLRNKLLLDSVNDFAWDPGDSSLVVCGYRITNRLGVRRWKRGTDQVTILYDATPGAGWSGAKQLEVDPDRAVACGTSAGIVRIPTSGPAVVRDDPAQVEEPEGPALDADGDYLVVEGAPGLPAMRVAKVNRATGVFTEIANVGPVAPPASFYVGIAAGDTGDVYLSGWTGELTVVHRGAHFGVVPLTGASDMQVTDLVYVNTGITTGIPPSRGRTSAVQLSAPVPNPARAGTTFRFALPGHADVRFAVYDVTGRARATLAAGEHAAGPHVVRWDGLDDEGRALPAGLYWARLETPVGMRTRKVVLAR